MSIFKKNQAPLVDIRGLHVRFNGVPVVHGVDLQLRAGQCLALVGESGSGKSVTARTLVGLTGAGAHVQAQRLAFAGQDLRQLDERAWRRLRGEHIGFVMQDALGSLDPLRRVGAEIEEPLLLHTDLAAEQRRLRVLELLRQVGVPEPEVRARQYPWQLSGGLRQRALIASAIACQPRLLIADEPTTALDATVQAQILDLLEQLRERDNSLLMVSHDLAVVARLADWVAVMRHGVVVEQGSVEQILQDPQDPYTQRLLSAARAVHFKRPAAPALALMENVVDEQPVVLEARGLSKAFAGPDGRLRQVLDDVSLQLRAGQTLGVVGESGSGKSTLGRILLGLERPEQGSLQLAGQDWLALSAAQQRQARQGIQVVFQDPLASFDPRYTVLRVLAEALAHAGVPRALQRTEAAALLERVQLPAGLLERRPLELSGGQRQRIAIARALAMKPRVLVLDEPVSALDVSVQARILALLAELKAELNLACLFISHDLGVVEQVSDHVLVMQGGRVVEQGAAAQVLGQPRQAYTRALLDAVPHLPAARPSWFGRIAV
ncbi:putative peptide transport fused subunits of ABC superfamily: ATP-binding components [Pseudomonas sp. JV551A1]|uniref:Peptide transport fused subunits of ABC superfamily: ATP-binding components n=1 Tax=Pseudomonas inefficax TaxID=2078786 RepID=A0AAQ1SU94_9PSED|nr:MULTISPECIES: ABC transporter ATP-binding protein [Pseudomonas]SPO56373.1 putative peptide transport fused subunits of ABC superfamily: ATP-binding components [Pseudomonas sp. JV551A1]SPO61860.1 putative peptide transport fused subunits of ABC superfamily: ATP-binding components [Pseudomonas inefficax]